MVVKNAQIIKNGIPVIQDILINNKCIELIADDISCPSGHNLLDIQGDYLSPGFVDVHTHAFMGMDMMQGENAVRHMSRELYKAGVQAFLPTTMSASEEDTLAAIQGVASVMRCPESEGAVVLGVHMEAPFLNSECCGAQDSRFFQLPCIEAFKRITGNAGNCVKMVTLAPELPGAFDFIQWLTQQNIVISIGHSTADAGIMKKAIDMGLNHVTHMFNALSPLLHRAPGVPGVALTDERVYAECIPDLIHLHREILIIAAKCKQADKMVLVTDAMEAAGLQDGIYTLGGRKVIVHDGAARLDNGTLAGSTLLMSRGVNNMINLGIAFPEAIKMAVSTPARSIGVSIQSELSVGYTLPLNRYNAHYKHVGVITN